MLAIRDAILGGLKAHAAFFDKVAKEWTERPDYRARREAAKLALAYGEALPLQRIVQQTLIETHGDLHDAMCESPELLKAVGREFEKAKFRRRNAKYITPAPAEIEASGSSLRWSLQATTRLFLSELHHVKVFTTQKQRIANAESINEPRENFGLAL